MATQCDRCQKWFMSTFACSSGGYWGKPIQVCFGCLSEHDQEEVRNEK
jgi:hypothetical protein